MIKAAKTDAVLPDGRYVVNALHGNSVGTSSFNVPCAVHVLGDPLWVFRICTLQHQRCMARAAGGAEVVAVAGMPCAHTDREGPCPAQGSGTVEGSGTLYGQGTLDGWAEMVSASGTFQGAMGICGGPTAGSQA